MLIDDRARLLTTLVESSAMQALWTVHDRGVPVFVHSVDVTLLALEGSVRGMDLDALVVSGLIHDVGKLERDGRSHSRVMRTAPRDAADPAMAVLAAAERAAEVSLGQASRAHVEHIVLSHHGQHGQVQPRTPEARLVAACDQLSGTEHRIVPIDANDILPLLTEGYRWGRAGALLGVGRELVKTRLAEACLAEGVSQWVDLLPIWRRHGRVQTGTARRQRQIARARLVARLAREMPACLLERWPGAKVAAQPVLAAV